MMELMNYVAIAVVFLSTGFLIGVNIGHRYAERDAKTIAEMRALIDEDAAEGRKPGPRLVTNAWRNGAAR